MLWQSASTETPFKTMIMRNKTMLGAPYNSNIFLQCFVNALTNASFGHHVIIADPGIAGVSRVGWMNDHAHISFKLHGFFFADHLPPHQITAQMI